ncbi:MAG: two-component regulator propeller domain-containing protein [Candidatus Hydrogenedentota bacterium]
MSICARFFITIVFAVGAAYAADLSESSYPLWNVVPPLMDPDDSASKGSDKADAFPMVVEPFDEHVRTLMPGIPGGQPALAVSLAGDSLYARTAAKVFRLNEDRVWEPVDEVEHAEKPWLAPRLRMPGAGGFDAAAHCVTAFGEDAPAKVNAAVRQQDTVWLATENGLYKTTSTGTKLTRHERYGVDGPLATRITDLAVDSKGVLWVGTPLGLSVREADGTWRPIRGNEGLPYKDVTSLDFDANDRLWIGTTFGAIQYRPYEDGRQWFYRQSKRYLPHDLVHDIAVSRDGRTIYTATEAGVGRIDIVTTTLAERARTIERRINKRHRRLGLVAACVLDDPYNPTSWSIPDSDNDGLWTSYHVAAMSLAYAVTGEEAAKASARESMHAMYMLQNASGIPGLVARSVMPLEEAKKAGKDKDPQWRLTPDGKMYWKSDTSSDEIDGHYLAFYTYWEHIAKDDPAERTRCIKQVRALTDYIVDNGYVLLDWDGKRTRWGFWSPELLNNQPFHYLESGLNSLEILSFLKTAHYITGDAKYQKHYESLMRDHHYLSNVLLEKKVFPDMNNHSDNQLAYVAWYPILQLEHDPAVRRPLHQAVRRHYKCLARDRSSFFYFVTATIDPAYVDVESAVTNLKRIPTDRRQWPMQNSHRADIVFHPRLDRFGERQLLHVLPADERNFAKWNRNVYLPDEGKGGEREDDGAAFLLPYWMARYHGFIAEKE